jgi:hypothetical protein
MNRASDAGPEPTAAPDWTDSLDFASDEVRAAMRVTHDCTVEQLRRRQQAIDRAIEHLRDAREALPQPQTAADFARRII